MMSKLDSLKIFDDLVAAGVPQDQARTQAQIAYNMKESILTEVKEWLIEAKADFASQKLVSIMGSLILIALTGICAELWSMNKDMASMNMRLTALEQKIK